MPQFLDPKNDLVFKRVFGEHHNLLMSFLNALIPMEPGTSIKKVEYLPVELSPVNPKDRNSIVDVRCTDNRGRHFIVEMQMEWSESFKSRLLFNAGKIYVKQLKRKDAYNTLSPVYTLAILNENFDRRTKEFYHHFQIVNRKNPEEIIQGMEFILVELTDKFKPSTVSDRRMMVLWLRFLKEVGEDMSELPAELQKNPLIRQAADLCREAAYSDRELIAYDAYWDGIRTRKAVMATTHEEGVKKGIAKGIAKVALKMVEDGMPFDMISKYTGLSISQIETLTREGIPPFVKEKPATAKAKTTTTTSKRSSAT